jgi:hypothetical protein
MNVLGSDLIVILNRCKERIGSESRFDERRDPSLRTVRPLQDDKTS